MENQGNKYAVAALKDRRATLAGQITDLRKRLTTATTQLDHIDATLTIFEYEGDPPPSRFTGSSAGSSCSAKASLES